jgi:hypothetical protein
MPLQSACIPLSLQTAVLYLCLQRSATATAAPFSDFGQVCNMCIGPAAVRIACFLNGTGTLLSSTVLQPLTQKRFELQVAPNFGRVGGFLRSIEEEMNNMLQVPAHWALPYSKMVCLLDITRSML